DLGASLKLAAVQLGRHLQPQRSQNLAAWARDVARWEVLPRSERERLVAAGPRWCLVAARAAPQVTAPPPRPTTPEGSGDRAAPLGGLPGVGPVTRDRLAQKGLVTVGDVLFFLPRRWDDLRQVVPIRALAAGTPQMTRGTVFRARIIPAFRRRILEVLFTD